MTQPVSLVALTIALVALATSGATATPSTHTARVPRPAFGLTATATPSQYGSGAAPLTISTAVCPAGTHATGGGWSGNDLVQDPINVTSSLPLKGNRGWFVAITNLGQPGAAGFTFTAIAECA